MPDRDPRRPNPQMLARRQFSTQETTAKRTFATKGEANEQILRKPEPGSTGRLGRRGADRHLPRLRLPAADRRPVEWRASVAPRLLRNHVDRAALLLQFRADAGHADHPRRAE